MSILVLNPGDYLVTAGGLKFENITKDLVIEFDAPEKITVSIMEITKNEIL